MENRRFARGPALPGVTLVAIALAVGIAVGTRAPAPRAWPWLLAAAGLLALAAGITPRRPAASRWLAAALTVPLGAARAVVRHHDVAASNVARWASPATVTGAAPVRVCGTTRSSPRPARRGTGSMSRFGWRPPATVFEIEARSIVNAAGSETPARGRVRVIVDEVIEPIAIGVELEVTGRLRRPGAPRNPGGPDRARLARRAGRSATLVVPRRELVVIRGDDGTGVWAGMRRARAGIRRRAETWLLGDLPGVAAAHGERDALLAALILGRRDAGLDRLGEAFRGVGLAHLLAISGMHLGILAGTVVLLARLCGGTRRWHGILVIAIVVSYLLIVELRMPVVRAAVMTVTASLGLLAGCRLRIGGLVAVSAVGLLVWRPDELFSPGFQLSFGVVLGLVHLSTPVRRRWFGPPERAAASARAMVLEWLKSAFAAAVVAWLVATPITLHHFGRLAPLTAPLTVVALPLVTMVLVTGYVKVMLGPLLPSASAALGWPLAVGTDLLAWLAETARAIPGSAIDVPAPSAPWAAAALSWVIVWARRPPGPVRWLWPAGAVLAVWLTAPLLPGPSATALRIDALAVGDGSCYVLRSRGRTVVFDAGSGHDLAAGQRTIVPALGALGVRSIDAVVVSHANLDHFSAVLELAEAYSVGEVLVTSHLVSAAGAEPGGPAASLLAGLERRGVAVRSVAEGDRRRFGAAAWEWLHPPRHHHDGHVNDASMVIRIKAAGRVVLLTGDVEAPAIRAVLDMHPDLRADVLELPHHGSFNAAAAALVERVAPRVVLQSTGGARLRHDPWESRLTGVRRLVTARDGAIWAEVDRRGRITSGSWGETPKR